MSESLQSRPETAVALDALSARYRAHVREALAAQRTSALDMALALPMVRECLSRPEEPGGAYGSVQSLELPCPCGSGAVKRVGELRIGEHGGRVSIHIDLD